MNHKITFHPVIKSLVKCCTVLFLCFAATGAQAQTSCDAHFSHYTLSNPDSLHFYPAVSGAASYSWNFGDGGTSSNQDPWHKFATTGIYNVCLTVVDTSGATCTWCDTVNIGAEVAPCNASFSHYTLSNPDSLHFYPNGSPGTAFYWNFGDGTTSADQYPWHFYTHPGTYDVCLTVADTSGVTCTKCDTVIIGAVATCSAAFNYYTLSNPDSLHFYATSTTGIATWYWNFGDGTTSSDQYPWHHFASSGTYNVCLTVVDSSGATCNTCSNVHVGPVATCSALFSHYNGINPDSLHFYPVSTTGVASYYWNFGDSSTSTSPYPWHFYHHAGTYYVCLTVVDTSGVTCTSCDTVHAGPAATCNAGFSHYVLNADSVHFYPSSTVAVSYYWSFGDGTTSTKEAPFHTYAQPGTYNACLTVADSSGATCTSCDTVVYVGPNVPTCSAAFSHYDLNGPDTLRFYSSAPHVASFSWNFGDGGTAHISNPEHIFTNPGTYYVCLSVVDSSGATCSSCDTVIIGTSSITCNAQFSYYTLTNPDSLHFYPTGTPASSYYWSFGDGTTSTLQYPWHHYSGPGSYHVCLTIEDTTGAQCTWCDSVHISGTTTTCNAQFAHYSITGGNIDSVHFYPTGPHGTSYYWTFGDGTSSSLNDPWHYYGAPGVYTACLTLVDSAGASCTVCDTVTVVASNTCSAQFSHYTIHNPDSLHFYPTGAPSASYYWSFGDGTNSTQQYPWHFYATAGTYYVCLTVADSAGLSCNYCDTVHVGAATACNAQFSHYSLTGVNIDSVHFYPGNTASGFSYYWNFGDGSTSTSTDPWHRYINSGTYYACLTVADTAGVTCTSCDTVYVGNPITCNAQFSHYSLDSTSDSLHFYPIGTGAATYYWNFGDSTTSTQQYPWHYYSSHGIYYVCLTVVDTAGTTCTQCDTVQVGHSSFHVASHHHTANADSVQFYPSGSAATAYYWDFGDGTYSSENSPLHIYPGVALYNVVLTAADSAGNISVSYDTVNTGATAIAEVEATTPVVKVYPNPMNEYAIVYLKNVAGASTFRLYDIAGQMIYSKENLADGSFVMSTKNISAGFYLYSVGDDNQIISQGKLMVIH